MPEPKRYIAFDLGAESGRGVVGEVGDGRIALKQIHRFPTPQVSANGALLWDILAIFEELKTGLAQAASYASSFDGISLDTWGVDYVLLDADGRLLGYPYHYRDHRTDGVPERAFEVMPRKAIYQRTGIQFMQINTLYQLLAEQQRACNLLDVAVHLLPTPNYLLYLLSGQMRGEYTIVSTTQLADPRQRDWAWDLIDAFGLPGGIFPEVVEPGTRLGPLAPELTEQAGLQPQPPVIAGASHDTAAAVAAIPAQGDNWAFLSSGSWSLMGVELDAPLIDARTQAGNFTNEGGVEGTTRFLKNIAGLWLLQECRRAWADRGLRHDYGELADMAAHTEPVRAWVDPDNPRFLQPGDMPAEILAFLQETDQPYREDVAWITRCVLESLAFKYRIVFRELEALTEKRLHRLHAVGGGIKNQLLCQMTADAIQRELVAGPVEGTVVGNVGVQAIATGVLDDVKHLRHVVARSFDLTTYEPRQAAYWDTHEGRFRSLLKS